MLIGIDGVCDLPNVRVAMGYLLRYFLEPGIADPLFYALSVYHCTAVILFFYNLILFWHPYSRVLPAQVVVCVRFYCPLPPLLMKLVYYVFRTMCNVCNFLPGLGMLREDTHKSCSRTHSALRGE